MLKYLYIAASHIRSMLKNNTFLSLLLVLGITVCNMVFLYFWGNIMHGMALFTAPAFEVYAKDCIDVRQLCDDLPECSSIKFYSPIKKDSLADNKSEYYDTDVYLDVKEDKEIYFVTYSDMSSKNSDASRVEPKNSVLVPDNLIGKKGELPDLVIDGTSYNVVGTSYSRDFLVSLDTFSENKLAAERIDMSLPAGTSKENISAFHQKLNSLLGDEIIINDVTKTEGSDFSDVSDILIGAIAVYALCLASLFYIIAYIFDESAFELSVYELLGGARRNMISILCMDMLLVLIISAVSACAIHQILYQPLFSRINVYEFVYTPELYIYPMMITIAVIMLIQFAFCRFKLKKNVVVNFRKHIK